MNNLIPQHIVLTDDGTLDTVVECDCPACEEHLTYRFSQEARELFKGDIEGMCVWAFEQESCLEH